VAEVQDLHLSYRAGGHPVHAVQGASLTVFDREAVGLVGESGCGKSSLARAIIGLLPEGRTVIEGGRLVVAGRDVTRLSAGEWPGLRGSPVAMVFQDSLSFLNPLMRIGAQVAEAVVRHDPGADPAARVRELIDLVRLPAVAARAYPYELSGGMRQRVAIAIALGCRPRLLVADEPTTALDVTTQAEILKLIAELQASQGMALILISHDLAVVRALCRRVYVMYAGRTVEWGPTGAVFESPAHPYVHALLGAARTVRDDHGRFATVEGEVPDLRHRIAGCPFAGRCPRALAVCTDRMPAPTRVAGLDTREVRCWLYEPDAAP
jgi:oligopeptide/dipeptide ABC transporter ATP-binding protein